MLRSRLSRRRGLRVSTARAVDRMPIMHKRPLCGCWVAFSLLAMTLASTADGADPPGMGQTIPVDYTLQIKPLFTRHCVSCHGAVKARGNLRLDTAAFALKGGKAGTGHRSRAGRGESDDPLRSRRG